MRRQVAREAIKVEGDLVALRHRAKRVAQLLGFDGQDQTRIATAVSEIARNALRYAGGGAAEFLVQQEEGGPVLVIAIADHGPGIADLDAVLEGRYRSTTGLGMGVLSAQRLMDGFSVDTGPQGTRVTLRKRFPRRMRAPDAATLEQAAAALAQEAPVDPLRETALQNQELLGLLTELKSRQDELERLNRELADTNRGVVALYAELDDKAEQLRRANDLKTRFLANMSHEFRTPLNSVLALSRLLLERIDGDLTMEQQRQVMLIRKSAESLTDLVNDLLDIAKVEAGKVEVRPGSFHVSDVFGALRGLMRPLRASDAVELVLEEDPGLPALTTDEAKVSQILRNLVANALKFTETGTVRVSARLAADKRRMLFEVADTGIGIATEHHERIFEEFSQIESRLQGAAKGTGLGLPLSRRLAELLGGSLSVASELGAGATFTLDIPLNFEAGAALADAKPAATTRPAKRRVLVIDDDEASRYVFRQLAPRGELEVLEAADGEEGLRLAVSDPPDAIVLDLRMPGLDGFAVLERLRAQEATCQIPVIVTTASALSSGERQRLSSVDALLPKSDLSRDTVASALATVLKTR
jgi:signal transduction histidine kinase/CheY-like chemotaxis protein